MSTTNKMTGLVMKLTGGNVVDHKFLESFLSWYIRIGDASDAMQFILDNREAIGALFTGKDVKDASGMHDLVVGSVLKQTRGNYREAMRTVFLEMCHDIFAADNELETEISVKAMMPVVLELAGMEAENGTAN